MPPSWTNKHPFFLQSFKGAVYSKNYTNCESNTQCDKEAYTGKRLICPYAWGLKTKKWNLLASFEPKYWDIITSTKMAT